jgi:hypothetical protein
MTDLSKLRLCVDRIVPDERRPAAASMETALRDAANILANLPNLDGGDVVEPARAALLVPKKWPGAQPHLKCRFLDGSDTQRRRVEEKAHMWEQYANVRITFGDEPDSQIRISFTMDGSWSAVGTDCLNTSFFDPREPTMNYGWLEDDTEDEEYERVVVHEFGHALGYIHEHQSPAATALRWNVDEVYRVFSGSPNFWSREEIDHNILQRYSETVTNHTAFDRDSIMLYAFPASLFLDGTGTPNNTQLSDLDKSFIAQVYGKPSGGGGSGGEPRLLKVTTPYMRGPDVEEVQERLNGLGYGPLATDGIYGPMTAHAVRRFQADNGLTVDGIVGPQTRGALEKTPAHA